MTLTDLLISDDSSWIEWDWAQWPIPKGSSKIMDMRTLGSSRNRSVVRPQIASHPMGLSRLLLTQLQRPDPSRQAGPVTRKIDSRGRPRAVTPDLAPQGLPLPRLALFQSRVTDALSEPVRVRGRA
ncbi:hypothetical protein [Thiocystis violacea]|uniref:hypothetical protein n=1 Tax=Thiocystis violacea TaxID=13725 RepID=UPI0019040B4F|nr:hypothetical protein [Thiocystis violacea]